jgi:DNA repair protein SbcD/Mre11
MKIIHSSNIHLGKSFAGQSSAGDRLRAAIKTAFSRLIDLALAEKADLVILAGDTFDSIDVSQNLLNFFLSEIKRLEKIPIVVLPGARDFYQKGSFWEEWEIIPPADNLYLITKTEKPYIEMPDISATIYGYPIIAELSSENPVKKLIKSGKLRHHIAVIYGSLTNDSDGIRQNYPFHTNDILSGGFDYAALGGQKTFLDFSYIGLKAAYPGSPEILNWGQDNAGQVIVATLEEETLAIEPRKIGQLEWKETTVSMETVTNPDDLKLKIKELAEPETTLKVNLEGLALFDAGLNLEELQRELEKNFLSLEFKDLSRVIPDNISEVKVREKTILGQYLKVMVDKLNLAEESTRDNLDESLKVGYTLLTGKEIW